MGREAEYVMSNEQKLSRQVLFIFLHGGRSPPYSTHSTNCVLGRTSRRGEVGWRNETVFKAIDVIGYLQHRGLM